MKRITACILSLTLAAGISAASGESILSGTVTSSRTEVVYAPYGGQIANVQVYEGDLVNIGDAIVDIEPTAVYAPIAGTVTAVFAEAGDSAESIEERYSAVLYMESNSRYTISASTERAYSASSTKMIHIGESVYISCTADGSHEGTGVITSIGDADDEGSTKYTVEVRSGTLFIGETVKICRKANYAAESCIGRGTVAQSKPVAVKGSGSILRLAVQPGDVVERGELLFETVEGSLKGLYAVDNHIKTPVSGIVAKAELEAGGTVAQNGVLISVYPQESLQIQVDIPVLELSSYHVGDKVSIEVDIGTFDPLRYQGSIARISHAVTASEDSKSTKSAKAWIDFEADNNILYGMPVTVYVPTADTSDAAAESNEPLD